MKDPAALGRANLAKSKTAERSVVAYLRAHGWPHAERTVRTGYRVAGRTSRDVGDIDGTPGLVWQVKNVDERRLRVPVWLAETRAQGDQARADFGVLVVKRAGHAYPATWWAYLELSEFLRLVGATVRPGLATALTPVRLELAGVLPLLHAAGYGSAPAVVGGAAS